MTIQDFRPDEIILGYWKQVLDINETDDLLDVELLIGGTDEN